MTQTTSKMTRYYQPEEIQEILHLALTKQDLEKELTREQLVEIAEEMGISPESLQAAEEQWIELQGEERNRQSFNRYRRQRLQKQAGKFVIGNSFFLLLNLVSAGEFSWSLYIFLFWGLFFGLNVWNNYHLSGEEYEQAYRNWFRKYQFKKSIDGFVTKVVKFIGA